MGKSPDYLFWMAIEEIAYAFMEKNPLLLSSVLKGGEKKSGHSDHTLNYPEVNSWQTKSSQMTLDLMTINSLS